jgi:hypothetical protein
VVTKINKKSVWGVLADEVGRPVPGAKAEKWQGDRFQVVDELRVTVPREWAESQGLLHLAERRPEVDEDGYERLPEDNSEDPC